MSGPVRSIASAPRIDPAESIAAALESIARQIRTGGLAVHPSHCVIALMGRDGDEDDVAATYFGAGSGAAQVLGMLELAKMQLLEDS